MARQHKCLDCGRDIDRHSRRCASCAAKEIWTRPGYKDRLKKLLKAALEDPVVKERHGLSLREAWKRPGAKERRSILMRQIWNRPELKARKSGSGNPNWKGGQILFEGRVKIWTGPKEYRYRSRLIAEEVLGRPLKEVEVVHHKSGDIKDDRPENLLVCSIQEHMRIHVGLRWRDQRGRLTARHIPDAAISALEDGPAVEVVADEVR